MINGLLPFRIVESLVINRHFKHLSMSLLTFCCHFPALLQLVEYRISSLILEIVSLVFSGRTADASNYLKVFASFPPTTVMFSFVPAYILAIWRLVHAWSWWTNFVYHIRPFSIWKGRGKRCGLHRRPFQNRQINLYYTKPALFGMREF